MEIKTVSVLFCFCTLCFLWHESNQYTNCIAHLECNGLNWGQGLGHVPTIVLKIQIRKGPYLVSQHFSP